MLNKIIIKLQQKNKVSTGFDSFVLTPPTYFLSCKLQSGRGNSFFNYFLRNTIFSVSPAMYSYNLSIEGFTTFVSSYDLLVIIFYFFTALMCCLIRYFYLFMADWIIYKDKLKYFFFQLYLTSSLIIFSSWAFITGPGIGFVSKKIKTSAPSTTNVFGGGSSGGGGGRKGPGKEEKSKNAKSTEELKKNQSVKENDSSAKKVESANKSNISETSWSERFKAFIFALIFAEIIALIFFVIFQQAITPPEPPSLFPSSDTVEDMCRHYSFYGLYPHDTIQMEPLDEIVGDSLKGRTEPLPKTWWPKKLRTYLKCSFDFIREGGGRKWFTKWGGPHYYDYMNKRANFPEDFIDVDDDETTQEPIHNLDNVDNEGTERKTRVD